MYFTKIKKRQHSSTSFKYTGDSSKDTPVQQPGTHDAMAEPKVAITSVSADVLMDDFISRKDSDDAV